MAQKKEMDILVKAIRANGFKVVNSGKGGAHRKVLDKNGAVVLDSNGPLILSGSPGERRWREMHVHRLMHAGVLKKDPWASGVGIEPNGAGRPGMTDEQKAAIRRAVEQQQHQREAETRALRERLEPIVVQLGGWNQGHGPAAAGIAAAEFGRVARYYAGRRGRVENWPTDSAAAQSAHTLKRGGTLSDNARICWALLVDELERDPDGPRMRYLELVRQARGLAEPEIEQGENGELVELEIPKMALARDPVERRLEIGPLYRKPRYALEALAYMARGAEDSAELSAVIVLAEKILEMEMKEGEE